MKYINKAIYTYWYIKIQQIIKLIILHMILQFSITQIKKPFYLSLAIFLPYPYD